MAKIPMILDHIIIPWIPPPRPRYILTVANIIDPVPGTVLENATIHLCDGIIKSINGDATEWSDDTFVLEMDLGGKYVCPGLIDCHVHLAAVPGKKGLEDLKNWNLSASLLRQPQVCKSMLERGFTTVRDCGGALAPLKKATEDYVHPGPRLFIAGHALSQTGGHADIREQLNEHECCGGTIQGIGRVVDGVPDSTVENDHTSSVSHASFLAAVSETIPPVSPKDHYDRLHINSLAQQEDAYSTSNIVDQLPSREVSEALVDLFFTFLETNWYYFDKKRFRDIFTELYADRPSTQQLRCANVCHVLLVLALATRKLLKLEKVKVRVFWTIYTMERLISGIMSLPTMLQVKDISVSLPQKRQDLDGDDCQAADRLIAITKLTMGTDEIINEVPIDKIPIDVSKSPGPSFRADAHLQIIYLLIWVTVGRGATLRLVRQTLQPPSVSMALGVQEAYLRSQRLVEKCIEAATMIINWITQLHHRALLAKYSFTDFHTCSSATIVLLLHSLLYPTYDSLPITQGINALKFMAEGSRLAMNALRLIERLQEAIQKSSSVEVSGSPMNQPSLSGMVVGLDLSQIQPFGSAGNLPLASTSNYESFILPTNQTLFPDLEPWLLEYSDQDLMLFGFDGFGSVFNADVSQT
ncbi:linoleate diol synthase [Fusarium phyllophilum]|uniref:Linoleate diol synthase n=1 Tax=Fusarium phyllophilum TaxID=47803 RepID=A0A8H5MYU2_9HYPO|nr:linoleate diol synthase [Fusarium phyllophilum]